MIKGLTSQEADRLLNQYGLNIITEQMKKNILVKFFEQFNNFLTILLIIAATLSFFIGEPVDGTLILAIVVLNAFFGLYQEGKAEQAIGLLKKMTITKIRVIRDMREQEIDSRYLAPGDVVFIEEGLKIPADANIVEARNLEINEAVLTGESLPVEKKQKDEIFMGTIVVRGSGYGKISKTGMQTKFGQIAKSLETIKEAKTPLQKKLEGLTKIIGIVGIALSFLVFALSLMQGGNYFPAFLLAISLAVAVVPEGLPAVMTITLAIGVREMAKRRAIIRKLSAIEALGSVTLIATDKTGTLTTNKMKVKEIFVDGKIYGEKEPPSVANHPFSQILLNGILCSTASLVFMSDHDRYDVLGDPTEGSLLILAQEMGIIPDEVRRQWQIVEEVPFDSVTKRMSVLVKKIPMTKSQVPNKSQIPNSKFIFSKGAPESILPISEHILIGEKKMPLTSAKLKEIKQIMHKWARKGLRVLAFASSSSNIEHLTSNGLTFLGMVAIHDPPRLEALEAIAKARQAGIKVVMITGDNEITAEAIGITTGLIKEGEEIVTGVQLESYSEEELLKKLTKVRVFARTTPFHKSRIVKLYQELGEIVAVTGDGVNDVIALKQADVGVAMGLVGTDVARETADMVITDDNFASIVNAVEEGRNIIKNLKNAIKYLLSCNVSEALSLIVALALGIPNLFFAIQLLYINLITDGVPALALAFSPRQERVMKNPPFKDLELLTRFGKRYIFAVGLLAMGIVLSAYFIFRDDQGGGRTGAFSVLVFIQSFIFMDLWISHHSLRKDIKKLFSLVFIGAFVFPFILQYFIVSVPTIAHVFYIHTVPIFSYILYIALASVILFSTKGLRKFFGH